MRSNRYLGNFFAAAVIASALLISAGSVTAQGRGKGHGGNGKHGDREARREQFGDWGGRGNKERGDRDGRRQQQISDWNGRRQQEVSDWNSRRQQQMSDWNSRQQQSDWHSKRQQKQNERFARRQQQIDWNGRRGNDWNGRRHRKDDDDNRWERRRNRRPVYYAPAPVYNVYNGWNGGNWGQWNAAYNRHRGAWKAERKAQKRFEKEQRRYARLRDRDYNYGNYNYYGDNNYYGNDYGYYENDDRSDWKQYLLQTVLANVLNGNGGFDGGQILGGFEDGRVTRRVYNRQAPSYYNSPLYVNYSPNYEYSPEYADNGFSDGNGLDHGSLLGQLPVQELISNYAGDGFVSQLLGGFVSQGYDQGFLAGQNAREDGQGEEYFNDPYTFDDGIYDPYSSSLGDNRQLLSEGYALGYQDALNGRQGYDPTSNGNVDLVSLLLSNVLATG